MKREDLNTRGISEVFGVMLILTVTLIVACLVAVFVGGFSFGAEEQAISANLVASGLDTSADPPYILFEHVSGDPVDLNAVAISLGLRSSAKTTTYIQNTEDYDYLQNYDPKGSSKITVGGKFVLYADGRYDDGADGDDDGIYWGSPTARFSAPWNDYITYQILDTRSNRPISSGKIPVSWT